MSLDNIKRVERVQRARSTMDPRREETAEKKRHDRINGNLEYMKEQKKQEKESKEKQEEGKSKPDNKEKSRRIDVNNADVHEIKAQMEARNVGRIQKLRNRIQGDTTCAIRTVQEDRGRKRAIEEYEKNFEIEDDGESR